ncbi:hypothetical protein P4H66_07540 [Paenibacillus dokdonensis]|uniref:DUF2642 domain-containing protein n=1 Tax=Paenibacillus dokdonensis TaxID=2567944 RepID=A0ABU6GN79_9BACL|nr:hypothetical protein [Paenibacillus dokdonensis]MEC0239711.1 hypothetical protein [Paenibacillus dokdonensis]
MKLRRKTFNNTNCVQVIRKKKPSPHGKTGSVRRKLNELKRLLAGNIARLAEQIRRLRYRVNRLSARVNSLQDQVELMTGNQQGTKAFFIKKVHSKITIETPAGTIFGTLTLVGNDFIQLREPDGSIVLLPLRSVLSIL